MCADKESSHEDHEDSKNLRKQLASDSLPSCKNMASSAVSNSRDFSIPLVDFSLFRHGTPTQRRDTARQILSGFQRAGFIYLANHGVPSALVAQTYAASAAFFARPQAEKDAVGWTTPASNRGYVAHGREKVTNLTRKEDVERLKAQVPDLKESMEIGREGEAGHPNRWPGGDVAAARFRTVMLAFFAACQEVHVEVMRAVAVGMGLAGSWFDGYVDAADNTLRLLHYPATPTAVFARNERQVRAGEHTDYGTLTLLFQDERGGLQVQEAGGRYVDATPVPGTIVVNAGDLLARWSNDTIRSTMHRVVQPPSGPEGDVFPARYSLAYFCNPNFDRMIEAIEGTYGDGKGERVYEGIMSGEYVEQRLAATY